MEIPYSIFQVFQFLEQNEGYDPLNSPFSTYITYDLSPNFDSIGNTKEISMKKLAELAVKISEKKLNVKLKLNLDKTFNTDSPKRRCPNLDKIYNLNKWEPKIKLEIGLLRTINYYKTHKE